MNRSILILSTSFPRHADDDAAVFVLRLVCALSDIGEHGTVLAPKDLNQETLVTVGNFSVIRFRYGIFKPGYLAFGAGIVPNIKHKPVLIFQIPFFILSLIWNCKKLSTQNTIISAQWIVSGFAALFVSWLKDIPYTVTVRGEDMRMLKLPLIGALFRNVLKKATAIVAVSKSFEQEIKSLPGINASRVHLIENGITEYNLDNHSETVERLQAIKPYLVFVGTVIPRKQIDILLRLMACEPLAPLSLIVCGRMNELEEVERLANLTKELKIGSRVYFEGLVPPERIGIYLNHAHAYISASAFEGRPNAALEALSLGTLAILSDIPAHREVVRDGENGIIIDTSAINQSAERIRGVLDDQALLEKLRTQGKLSVAGLRWESTAAGYKKVFDALKASS